MFKRSFKDLSSGIHSEFGRSSGVTAVLLDLIVVAFLLTLSVSGVLKIFFPVMALPGPMIIIHSLITFLYTLLPAWVAVALLALGITSILYTLWEPILPTGILAWMATLGLVGSDLIAAVFLPGSTLAAAVNNLTLLIAAAGMANLWAQGGIRIRDLSIFDLLLAVYDALFTLILPTQANLFWRLVGLPFAPLIAWPSPMGWLAFGLGDLIVICL